MEVFRSLRLPRDLAEKLRERWEDYQEEHGIRTERDEYEIPVLVDEWQSGTIQEISHYAASFLRHVFKNSEARSAITDASIEYHLREIRGMFQERCVMDNTFYELPIEDELDEEIAEFAQVRAHLTPNRVIPLLLEYALDH